MSDLSIPAHIQDTSTESSNRIKDEIIDILNPFLLQSEFKFPEHFDMRRGSIILADKSEEFHEKVFLDRFCQFRERVLTLPAEEKYEVLASVAANFFCPDYATSKIFLSIIENLICDSDNVSLSGLPTETKKKFSNTFLEALEENLSHGQWDHTPALYSVAQYAENAPQLIADYFNILISQHTAPGLYSNMRLFAPPFNYQSFFPVRSILKQDAALQTRIEEFLLALVKDKDWTSSSIRAQAAALDCIDFLSSAKFIDQVKDQCRKAVRRLSPDHFIDRLQLLPWHTADVFSAPQTTLDFIREIKDLVLKNFPLQLNNIVRESSFYQKTLNELFNIGSAEPLHLKIDNAYFYRKTEAYQSVESFVSYLGDLKQDESLSSVITAVLFAEKEHHSADDRSQQLRNLSDRFLNPQDIVSSPIPTASFWSISGYLYQYAGAVIGAQFAGNMQKDNERTQFAKALADFNFSHHWDDADRYTVKCNIMMELASKLGAFDWWRTLRARTYKFPDRRRKERTENLIECAEAAQEVYEKYERPTDYSNWRLHLFEATSSLLNLSPFQYDFYLSHCPDQDVIDQAVKILVQIKDGKTGDSIPDRSLIVLQANLRLSMCNLLSGHADSKIAGSDFKNLIASIDEAFKKDLNSLSTSAIEEKLLGIPRVLKFAASEFARFSLGKEAKEIYLLAGRLLYEHLKLIPKDVEPFFSGQQKELILIGLLYVEHLINQELYEKAAANFQNMQRYIEKNKETLAEFSEMNMSRMRQLLDDSFKSKEDSPVISDAIN
jgi:hypothetical protein